MIKCNQPSSFSGSFSVSAIQDNGARFGLREVSIIQSWPFVSHMMVTRLYHSGLAVYSPDSSQLSREGCQSNSLTNCSLNRIGRFTHTLIGRPYVVSIPPIQYDENIETLLQTVKWDKAR
jgi:hypothetical protein